MMKKVPLYWHSLALKALRQSNDLISAQKTALKNFKAARQMTGGSSLKTGVLRAMIQAPKEITGRAGKKNLNKLMRDRKDLAVGARLSEGAPRLGKLKWNENLLKNLRDQTKRRQWNYERWSSSGARPEFLKEASEEIALHKKAKGQVVDRMVNARGKGISFRKINGRIVPIRKK